jgi:hypothetical protein
MMGNRLSAKETVSLGDLVVRPGVPPEQPMSADIIRQGLTDSPLQRPKHLYHCCGWCGQHPFTSYTRVDWGCGFFLSDKDEE